jgi:hypothetical protein
LLGSFILKTSLFGKNNTKHFQTTQTNGVSIETLQDNGIYPIKIIGGKYVNLFSWVKRKFKSPKTLAKIKHRFNETELKELRDAGFPI